MENISEIEIKVEMDYNPKQIYRDTSNNYIRVLYSLKSYQNNKPTVHSSVDRNEVHLKLLYSSGELREESIEIDNFEKRLNTGEIKEYFPNDVEKAKLALRGFFR